MVSAQGQILVMGVSYTVPVHEVVALPHAIFFDLAKYLLTALIGQLCLHDSSVKYSAKVASRKSQMGTPGTVRSCWHLAVWSLSHTVCVWPGPPVSSMLGRARTTFDSAETIVPDCEVCSVTVIF